MMNRLLAFLGACGLVLALTALTPMLPAYADGSDCDGDCTKDCDDNGCDDDVFCECTLKTGSCPCE
jgi:hypothetical protein